MSIVVTWEILKMRQKSLSKRQKINGCEIVEDAHARLREMVGHEAIGHGDRDNALRRIASRLHVSYSYLWRVLYKSKELKDITGSALLKIYAAHEALCDRQRKKYEAARDETDETFPLSALLSRVAAAIAGEDDEPEGGTEE